MDNNHTKKIPLSIIIPTKNEAQNLPLLLADLKIWPYELDLIVIDSCSSDLTTLVASTGGAKVYHCKKPNRGIQLHKGAMNAIGDWYLFLHADCRLPREWINATEQIINQTSSKNYGWFFDFKILDSGFILKILEQAVSLRNKLLVLPYGDQGLLLHSRLYKDIGGFSPFNIMEDIDFILRIKERTSVKRVGLPIYSSKRRWEKNNILIQSIKNSLLRKRWRRGEDPSELAKEYYANK